MSKSKIIVSSVSRFFLKKAKVVLIISLMQLGNNLCLAQDGSLDLNFNLGIGPNNALHATSIQSDGKIIIGGFFDTCDGTARSKVARLNTDGSLDTSFNPGTGANYEINTTSIQSDGKIIIGGYFTSYNGTSRNRIARLNTDGSVDLSFNSGSGVNTGIFTTSVQSDGKIIIGGEFNNYNGITRGNIARLNTNGSLDTSFDPGMGANTSIYITSIQNDGKIIIGGDFTSYNGTSRSCIARLNTDGSLDLSFNPGTGANDQIRTTSIQSDGRIIIGGWFNFYNGMARNHIARLNIDGSLDTTFNIGTGANNYIYSTCIQSDGKIIIGGAFTEYYGTTRNSIARLNIYGSPDSSFNPGTGANNLVRNITIQSDGKIIIGGYFTNYNGTARNYIARLNTTIISGIYQWEEDIEHLGIFPNPFSHSCNVISERELRNAVLTLYNSFGQLVRQVKNVSGFNCIINRDNLPEGMYYLSLSQNSQILLTEKLVISDQ